GFSPIGSDGANFTGSYNGQGFRVDSLKITRPGQDNIGFFGFVNSTDTLKNIAITNCSIQGSNATGGLVGKNYGGTISNSYATGSVPGSDYIGGLVGNNFYGTISNSYATGSVSGSYY